MVLAESMGKAPMLTSVWAAGAGERKGRMGYAAWPVPSRRTDGAFGLFTLHIHMHTHILVQSLSRSGYTDAVSLVVLCSARPQGGCSGAARRVHAFGADRSKGSRAASCLLPVLAPVGYAKRGKGDAYIYIYI